MSDVETMREALIGLQRRHDSAQVQLKQYGAIFESTQAILAASNHEDIQAAMFRGVLDASGASAASVFEMTGGRLVCSRASDPVLVGVEMPPGPVGDAVIAGRALALPDIRRPPEFQELVAKPGCARFVSAALFPFQSRAQNGVLLLLGPSAGFFQAADVERLKTFAMLAAQGMAALYRLQLIGDRATAEAARQAAVAADSAKSMFLASMSHEIRTPLNGVLGMAQSLHADDLAPAQKDKVSVILDSGSSLLALLNDVLDFSKIEAGKMEIAPVEGDLLETLERTRALFGVQADDKGLELDVSADVELPRKLVYDAERVRQCISNLLSNAIKFTASGRVSVRASARREQDGGYLVTVAVSDTGIGIAPDMHDKLFNVFTQVDGSISRKFGGSGLGLAISQRLARLMGGDIAVTSQVGEGSTFSLSFRAAASADNTGASETQRAFAPMAAVGASAWAGLKGVRILLTDDNAVNRQVVKLFLAPHRVVIVEATNGAEALERLAQGPFDLVLLDVHMPVMDGKEAIRRIRASDQAWRDIPVIALTADAMHGDRERFIAMGMSDYVAKPIDQRLLVSKIEMLAGRSVDEPALVVNG